MSKKMNTKIGIKSKLILMFVLLITIPIIAIGTISYRKSVSIMEENLKESTLGLLKETKQSIENFTKGYEDSIDQMALDPNVQQLVNDSTSDEWLMNTFKAYIKSHKEVKSIYIGTIDKNMHLYPSAQLSDDYDPTARPWYQKALEKNELIWTDPYIDDETGELVVSIAKPVYNSFNEGELVGVVAVDLLLDTLAKEINSIKIGKKGYPILMDNKGKVMTHKDKALIGKPLSVKEVNEAMNSKKEGYVDYKWMEDGIEEDKFAVFMELDKIDWTVLATMYVDEIEEDASIMLTTGVIFGLITLVLSIIIAILFSRSLTKHIGTLLENMEKIEDGDFRVNIDIKSKDEIGRLGEGFNLMVREVGSLVKNVQRVSSEVTASAETLAATAEETSASSEEVARTVEEIAKGASEQASEAEKGAMLTGKLSGKFERLTDSTDEMLASANEVMEANLSGVKAVEGLRERTKENDSATRKIERAITDLDSKTKYIGNIIETIGSIAEQTNLLALNASIEAARAGEHGKGFAVVADEIRKLAEDSRNSAEEIKEIVVNIQKDSSNTVQIMDEVKTRSIEQSKAVTEVDSSFEQISGSIDSITHKIERIVEFVQDVNKDKDSIVAAIENISAVSEETAAASEEVSASMQQQSTAVDEVAKLADTLNNLSLKLNNEINKFKV